MGLCVIMPLLLCAMTLLSDITCSSTLEAKPGENVTIWNEDILDATGYISWFQQRSDSVPLLIGCKQVERSGKTKKCYFYNESERITMSVHGKKTSLTITAVNVSDTGLYYCGYTLLAEMTFCKSVVLQVKGGNETPVKDLAKATDRSSSNGFFMLMVVSGAGNIILLSILIFIILKRRKTHTGANSEVHEDQDSGSLHYAALQLSNKKTKRKEKHDELEDPDVLYSSVRH